MMKMKGRVCSSISYLLSFIFIFYFHPSYGFLLSDKVNRFQSCHSRLKLGKNSHFDGFYGKFASQLSGLSINGIMDIICLLDPPPNTYLFPKTDLSPESIPTINRFLIANPQTFFLHEDLAKAYGASFERLFLLFHKYQDRYSKFKYYLDHPQEIIHDLSLLAYILPVIYIAEYNRGANVVGFQINSPSCKFSSQDTKDPRLQSAVETMRDLFPYFKAIRSQEIYTGGFEKKGSPFLMLNQIASFPGNRKFRTLPGREDFAVYYSRDVAMANDLLLTKDAKPTDFKFFQYSTNWSPQELERQCADQLWLVVDAPSQLIFARDTEIEYPLYSRVVNSILHPDFEAALFTAETPEIQKKRRMLFQNSVGGPIIGAAGGGGSSSSSRSSSSSTRRASRDWEGLEGEDDEEEAEIDLNQWKQSRENRKQAAPSSRSDFGSPASTTATSSSSYNPFTDSPLLKIPTTPQHQPPSFSSVSPRKSTGKAGDKTDFDRQLAEMTNRFRVREDDEEDFEKRDDNEEEVSEDFDENFFARVNQKKSVNPFSSFSSSTNSKKGLRSSSPLASRRRNLLDQKGIDREEIDQESLEDFF